MARLLVRSPQTRSNITTKKPAIINSDSPLQNSSLPSNSQLPACISSAQSQDKGVSSNVEELQDSAALGRFQSWSERRQDEAFPLQVSSHSKAGLTERRESGIQSNTLMSQRPQKSDDAVDRVDVFTIQQSQVSPPHSIDQQLKPKTSSKAPLHSVGAALERKLHGDHDLNEHEPFLLVEAAAPKQEPYGSAVHDGKLKYTAASAVPETSISTRDRQYSQLEPSSFSFQKSFDESSSAGLLAPSAKIVPTSDQATNSTQLHQLSSADVLAATSIVDLTNRQTQISNPSSVDSGKDQAPQLSYEANAFVTNIKFAISDEARFLQELGSSRSKVIAERRKKIEQLVTRLLNFVVFPVTFTFCCFVHFFCFHFSFNPYVSDGIRTYRSAYQRSERRL
jgi:hypothetical protein